MTGNDTHITMNVDDLREQFERDPLSMLAVAGEAGRGRLDPGPEVRRAMAQAAPAILSVPRRTVVEALLNLLVTDNPIRSLEVMSETGLMARLLPEVERMRAMPSGGGRHKDVYRHTLLVVARTPPDPLTRLSALMHDVGKPDTKVVEHGVVKFPGHAELGADMTRRRLRELGFDRATNDAITTLVALHLRCNSYEDDWTDAATRRLAREAGDQFDRLLQLSRADVTSARREAVERAIERVDALEARVAALRAAEDVPVSPLDGAQLMAAFNRPPGPWIGRIKDRLAAMVGDGQLGEDDTERAWQIAREMVAELTD